MCPVRALLLGRGQNWLYLGGLGGGGLGGLGGGGLGGLGGGGLGGDGGGDAGGELHACILSALRAWDAEMSPPWQKMNVFCKGEFALVL